MPSVDKLLKASQDPSCIMAVFPYQGGIWASPLGGASEVTPIPGSAASGSWAVRNGLLKYNNMDANSGTFAVIDTDKPRYAETQLDLRGRPINSTFIIRAKLERPTNTNAFGYFYLPLMAQGVSGSGFTQRIWHATVTWYMDTDSATIRALGFDKEGIEFGTLSGKIDATHLTEWRTYGFTHHYQDGVVTSKAFLDGGLLMIDRYTSNSGVYSSLAHTAYGKMRFAGTVVSDTWLSKGFDQYEYGMVFNRVLSDEEIKALS